MKSYYSDLRSTSACQEYSAWLDPFVSDRSYAASCLQRPSVVRQRAIYGVPQGSVFGPLLSAEPSLYGWTQLSGWSPPYINMLTTQMCVSSPVVKVTALVHRLAACLTDVEDWMMASIDSTPAQRFKYRSYVAGLQPTTSAVLIYLVLTFCLLPLWSKTLLVT